MPNFLQNIASWFGFGDDGTWVALFPQAAATVPVIAGSMTEIETSNRPEQAPIPEMNHETSTADTNAQTVVNPDLWSAFLRLGPDEFGDAVAFFDKTVLVENLQSLILRAELHLTGKKAGDPVVVLDDFGKTHSLLALYHLFSGIPASRLPGMEAIGRTA